MTCGSTTRFEFYKELYEKHNIKISFYPEFSIGGCGATIQNSFVIGPTGDLYKCWHDIGLSNKKIGNLNRDSIENFNVLSRYMGGENYLFDNKCQNCGLIPVCSGICIFYRIENKFNNKNHEICPLQGQYLKEFLEFTYEQYLNNNAN